MIERWIERLIVVVIILAIIHGVFWLERRWWKECLRVHPLWYCIEEKQ